MKQVIAFIRKNRLVLALAGLLAGVVLLPNPKPAVASGVWCYVDTVTCDYDCDTGGEGDNCHMLDHKNGDPPKPGG